MPRTEVAEQIAESLRSWLSVVAAIDEQIARSLGVGSSDLKCWHEVVVDGPLPAGELARRLHLTSGAITHLVDRLTRAGLIERIRDDTDRRRVLIAAIPETQERIIQAYARLGNQIQMTLKTFTAAEQSVIARFVEKNLHDAQRVLNDP